MINIEKEPFSVSKYYAGKYIKEDDEFEFTIVCTNTDLVGYDEDVVWVDYPPTEDEKELDKIEAKILTKFNKLSNNEI